MNERMLQRGLTHNTTIIIKGSEEGGRSQSTECRPAGAVFIPAYQLFNCQTGFINTRTPGTVYKLTPECAEQLQSDWARPELPTLAEPELTILCISLNSALRILIALVPKWHG